MTSFITACVHLDPIAIIQAGGYLGIALLIFAESGLLIGIFFPGDSLLFVAGLLAASGLLSIVPLTLLVIAAAIVGDSTGYLIGAKTGDALFSRDDSRFFKKSYVARTERFFADYGGRAIILARFVPIVRTIAPTLAGIGSMRYGRFLAYNAIGGCLWGAGVTLLGFFLGSLVPDSEHYIFPLSLAVIVISFIPILINLIRRDRR